MQASGRLLITADKAGAGLFIQDVAEFLGRSVSYERYHCLDLRLLVNMLAEFEARGHTHVIIDPSDEASDRTPIPVVRQALGGWLAGGDGSRPG